MEEELFFKEKERGFCNCKFFYCYKRGFYSLLGFFGQILQLVFFGFLGRYFKGLDNYFELLERYINVYLSFLGYEG